MKTSLLALALALSLSLAAPALADGVDDHVLALQQAWDHISFAEPQSARLGDMSRLNAQAHAVVAQSPGRAEPLVWAAIISSSEAGLRGGFSGLRLASEAKTLLEQAEHINPRVLDGSVYTTLGSLYTQVPGAPIGFGNHDRARTYLQRALALNPNGIEPNYFMGDLLLREHDNAGAIRYLQRALAAPARPGRAAADASRRAEARALLVRAQGH